MIESIEKKSKDVFKFKQFAIAQEDCSMKVGTDGILLGAWVNTDSINSILDIGAGTGLISLMLAQRTEKIAIHAIEVDENAWNQANQNFQDSPWKERLEVIHSSIQDYAKLCRSSYDLIVSNPPFFTGGVFSTNQSRASVRHTIKLPNGDLLSAARNLLSKEGRFCVILPVIEGLRFQEMASNYGLYCNKMTEVRSYKDKPPNRLLMEFEKHEKEMKKNDLTIWEKEGQYSEAQIKLTKEFYLNM